LTSIDATQRKLIVDVIEPIAMLALIGLAFGCRSGSSHWWPAWTLA
jgi:hypothetical protein